MLFSFLDQPTQNITIAKKNLELCFELFYGTRTLKTYNLYMLKQSISHWDIRIDRLADRYKLYRSHGTDKKKQSRNKFYPGI